MSQSVEELREWVPPDSFGLRLVALRRELGWGQEEAALKCGINPKTWGSWEVGAKPRNMAAVVDQIHRVTHVRRDWLMWGEMTSARKLRDPRQLDLDLVWSQPEVDRRFCRRSDSPLLVLVPGFPDAESDL